MRRGADVAAVQLQVDVQFNCKLLSGLVSGNAVAAVMAAQLQCTLSDQALQLIQGVQLTLGSNTKASQAQLHVDQLQKQTCNAATAADARI